MEIELLKTEKGNILFVPLLVRYAGFGIDGGNSFCPIFCLGFSQEDLFALKLLIRQCIRLRGWPTVCLNKDASGLYKFTVSIALIDNGQLGFIRQFDKTDKLASVLLATGGEPIIVVVFMTVTIDNNQICETKPSDFLEMYKKSGQFILRLADSEDVFSPAAWWLVIDSLLPKQAGEIHLNQELFDNVLK